MVRFLPILITAVASFAFGALYYMALAKPWMAALGKTEADMVDESGKPKTPVVEMLVSFIAEVIMAIILGILLARLGATAVTGAIYGVLIWFGFVVTTMATNHAYGGQKPSLTIIDSGHWLGVLVIQGLLLGAML